MPNHNATKVPLLILGAGMAGLGAAIEAQRLGVESLILEAANRPGGLCRNTTVEGCDFDFGPKILLLDDSNNAKDMLSFLGDNYEEYSVKESVYLSRFGLLGFPLQRNLVDLPVEERTKILADIEWAKRNPRIVRSYEDWLINEYGCYLCENVLLPYEEKKWQVSLDKLDYKWALSRPVKVDIEEVRQGAKNHLPPNRKYYYPRNGNISVLTNAMVKHAGPLLLGHEVTSIDLVNKQIVANGEVFEYEYLISSIPLNDEVSITKQMSGAIKNSTKQLLQKLGIRVFNLVFSGNYNLEGTAIYFAEKKFTFRRVSILENLCPALGREGRTPISVEISLSPNSSTPSEAEQLKMILKEFQEISQFAQLGKLIGYEMLEIDFAYPVQKNGLQDFVGKLHAQYEHYGVYHCGRGGNFDYCNSDIAFLQGKQMTQKATRLAS